ncbi:WbqC family protein [Rhodopirellula sp. P2]|uniref:WbqC family protein n=1 Tax=Rhodopirellula sp. P2 TaxID=2127060 RepID=UPI00236887E6|nr:WbqC family protein [Rhodopirellula sp. P2]WDQ15649.1 WbqC family protein [Rhodopirellula sp. P2]
MCKTVAVIQSSYLPWKGYFDIIHDVDLFIFYDDVQFSKNSWRNRNRIIGPSGPHWITVPVGKASGRLIHEVELTDHAWQDKHLAAITNAYRKSRYFKLYIDFVTDIFTQKKWTSLSELNQQTTRDIATNLLGIDTKMIDSRVFSPSGAKQERLIDLLKQAGATRYISGPAAKDYISEQVFRDNNIELIYKDYAGYPTYDQGTKEFAHDVTILDTLFHCGPSTPQHVWDWRDQQQVPNRLQGTKSDGS